MEPLATVILTGSRGRLGQAILSSLSRSWALDPYSRLEGAGYRSIEDFLAGDEPIKARSLIHCAWSTVPANAESIITAGTDVDLPLIHRLISRLQREPHPPLLIFISTGAVYGNARGRPSREDDIPEPIGIYARDKLAAEEILRASGLRVCILRLGNIYSLSTRSTDLQGVIAHLVRSALTNRPFIQWGHDTTKDYIHSQDFLTALSLIIDKRLEGTWNLGSGSGTSLSSLISLVELYSERRLEIIMQPVPAWDVVDNRLDISLLTHAIAWQPLISIDRGICLEIERWNNAM